MEGDPDGAGTVLLPGLRDDQPAAGAVSRHPAGRWACPNLLATVLFEKFGQQQHLNRQAERFALEGVPLGDAPLVSLPVMAA